MPVETNYTLHILSVSNSSRIHSKSPQISLSHICIQNSMWTVLSIKYNDYKWLWMHIKINKTTKNNIKLWNFRHQSVLGGIWNPLHKGGILSLLPVCLCSMTFYFGLLLVWSFSSCDLVPDSIIIFSIVTFFSQLFTYTCL